MAKPAILAALPDEPPKRTRRTRKPPQTAHEIQAAVEGVLVDRLEFMGQTYRVADKVGAIPYMRFTWLARNGLNLEDMDGMASVYEMLRDCFIVKPQCGTCPKCKAGEPCPTADLGDWPRFEADATRKKADAEDIMAVIQQAIEVMTARPTQRPSDSSAGLSTTSASSTESSSSQAIPDGLMSVDELLRRAEAG